MKEFKKGDNLKIVTFVCNVCNREFFVPHAYARYATVRTCPHWDCPSNPAQLETVQNAEGKGYCWVTKLSYEEGRENESPETRDGTES